MVTVNDIVPILGSLGFTVNTELRDSVRQKLEAIDQQDVLESIRSELSFIIWDKESPINGVPAEKFLARHDVDPSGEIYLIYHVSDGLLFFQPHPHNRIGIMTINDVEDCAKEHIDYIATSKAREAIINMVVDQFD